MGGFGGGFNAGLQRSTQDRAHKQELSDEDHEQSLQDHNNAIAALQQKMSQVGPTDPSYGTFQNQLNETMESRSSLFHPDRPGGLARLGKLLYEKVHGPTPAAPRVETTTTPESQGVTLPAMPGGSPMATPDIPSSTSTTVAPHPGPLTPAEAKARAARVLSYATPAAPLNKFAEQRRQLIAGGFTPAQVDHAMNVFAGIEGKPSSAAPHQSLKEYKLKDGTMAWLDAADPSSIPEGAQPIAGQPHQSTAALETYIRSQFPDPTAAQREWAIQRYQRLTHPATSGTRESLQFDENGNPIIVPLHTMSTKDFGADGPPPPNADGSPAFGSPGQRGSAPINTYANPEDQPPATSLAFNKGWTKPDWKLTTLSPQDEAEFQTWAKQNPQAVRGELDNPQADYDVRGHWLAGKHGDPAAKLTLNKWDGKLHGNDKFKTPYNGTFSNESMYATPDAPRWQGDKLVTKDGRLVADETPKTPATLKKKAAAVAGGTPKTDPRLAGVHRNTPAQTAAAKDVVAATKLDSLASDAWTNHSAAKDKQLALAIIRGAAGRVNMQEYDILTQKAGLANTLEAWANSATTGELPTDIRKQLVDVAHANLKASQDAQGVARGAGGPAPAADVSVDDIVKALNGGK